MHKPTIIRILKFIKNSQNPVEARSVIDDVIAQCVKHDASLDAKKLLAGVFGRNE